MKATKLTSALLLFSLAIFFSNCTPDRDIISSTEETLTQSNWSVDYYFQAQDLTAEYAGYRLLFSATGTVAAQKGNEIIQGTWGKVVDVNTDEIITINFSTSDTTLSKLNLGWRLVNKTSSTLLFEDNGQVNTSSQLRIKKE
ncbi:MAG: hypothetical protein ACHQEB_01870 [Chitinophagales bacterium]